MTFRPHQIRNGRATSYCAALIIVLSTSTALSQSIPTGLATPVPLLDQSQFLTNEYNANWGLPLHNFAAAYAAGATGQGVILGQLDTPLYAAHPEMEHLTLNSFADTPRQVTGGIDADREADFHGQHVAGLAVAARDGAGMHGGAFGVTTYFNAHFFDIDEHSPLPSSGAHFVNHSYGFNLSNYQRSVTRDGVEIGIATDNLSHMSLRTAPSAAHHSSLSGTVNVTAAGNDRYYATTLATNRYDARPRLFRGLPPIAGIATTTAGAASIRSMSNANWKLLEKNTVVAVMLNGTGEISSYSDLCGISKYQCIGVAGGMLAEPHQDYRVQLPDLPLPVDYYFPDSTGKKYLMQELSGEIWASQYRMLSLATRFTLPSTATDDELMASIEPIYRMALGTSMASPMLMAGHAVVKSRFPYLENWQVRDVVLTTGQDIGAPGIDRVYGWGIMDLDAAMGGPRKLFAVKRSYIQKNPANSTLPKNLYNFEIEQAQQYEVDVARADKFATRAYQLKVQMIELELAAEKAEKEAALPNTTEAKRAELLALAVSNRALITELTPQEQEQRAEAYRLELTRIQPNLAADTEEAAFESVIWNVNLPGERTEACDSDRCIADYWTNDIDGPGGLNKLGNGTLALAGTNSYQGGTTVSEGILQLGLGGETGSVEGNIVNNASIIVARSNEWNYKGSISGTGELNVYGEGTLRLSGASSYSGDTNVYLGSLAVDGSIASHANIFAGGDLSGHGTVGGFTAQNGGLVSPGNSIGTLTVNRQASFESGSIFLAEYDLETADRLAVNSDVSIDDSLLVLSSLQQDPAARNAETIALIGQRRTIIESGGNVTGEFSDVRSDAQSLFIDTEVSYEPASVSFGVTRNAAEPASFALNANQSQIADSLTKLPVSDPLVVELLNSKDAKVLARDYQSLTGELHASAPSFLLGTSNRVANAVNDRLRGDYLGRSSPSQAVIEPLAYAEAPTNSAAQTFGSFEKTEPATVIWGEAFGSWSRFDATQGSYSYDGRNKGLIAGGDLGFDAVSHDGRLGFFGAYQSGSLSSHVNGASSTDTYSAGLYTGFDVSGFGIRLGASYNWHEISTERLASLGNIAEINQADYDASSVNVFGEIAYAFKLHEATLEPFAALHHTRLTTDAFSEVGGITALTADKSRHEQTRSTLGLRASTSALVGEVPVTAHGTLGWSHGFGDLTPEKEFLFNGLGPLQISGTSLAKNAAVIEAGLEFEIAPNASLGISYQGQWASDSRENAVKADLAIKF